MNIFYIATMLALSTMGAHASSQHTYFSTPCYPVYPVYQAPTNYQSPLMAQQVIIHNNNFFHSKPMEYQQPVVYSQPLICYPVPVIFFPSYNSAHQNNSFFPKKRFSRPKQKRMQTHPEIIAPKPIQAEIIAPKPVRPEINWVPMMEELARQEEALEEKKAREQKEIAEFNKTAWYKDLDNNTRRALGVPTSLKIIPK